MTESRAGTESGEPGGADDVDVAVVGAGAAGLCAAIFAARAGARVRVLESKPRPGAKILISGGGRCNVLPSELDSSDFATSGSRGAMSSILRSWPLADVRDFFERDLAVPLEREPETGKLFPRSNRARDVLDALVAAAERAGAAVRSGFRLRDLRLQQEAGDLGFELASDRDERVRARRVVLATGGLSVPKTGSDGFGLTLARALGHRITPTFPALVPLVVVDGPWRRLAGISLVATVTARRGDKSIERRTGDLLFTHRGFSGPLALDMSRHVTAPDADEVHLFARFGTVAWDELLAHAPRGEVGALVRQHLPRRLAELLMRSTGVDPATRLSEFRRDDRKRLLRALTDCPLPIEGDEGYKKAEVTAGGVALSEVKTKTLESRRVPGLYLCGEILDVVGRIGGFNFLWAWVSGRRAGEAASVELGR